MSNSSISTKACWLITILTLGIILQQGKWKKENGYVFNDAIGYYAYLPATIIHHNWTFQDLPQQNGLAQNASGRRYSKYTMGTAICQLPTFLIAHAAASVSNYPADGYSTPYQLAIAASALLFLMLSLLLARSMLISFFSEWTSTWTLIIYFLGSNYLHYNSSYLSYSHIYSVFFVLLFIKISFKILSDFNLKNAIQLGLTAGMMTLIRPVDAIFILFPMLIQVKSGSMLLTRLQFLIIQHYKSLLLAVFCALLVWVPQLIYNFSVFERITINSYQGERFFFDDPEIFSALFSFNNGWLIYSPLMVCSVVGLFFTLKRKEWVWPVVFLLYVYVISSWWCWWYVGFGNRAFVNLGPMLLYPLAIFIAFLTRKKWLHVLFATVVFLGVSLNIFQNHQFENGAIHYESMTLESYQSSWLRNHPTFEFYDLLEKYDTEEAFQGRNAIHKMVYDTAYQQDFVLPTPLNIEHFQMYSGMFEFPVNEANTFVAEAWSANPCDGLSLMLETKPLEPNCPKTSYGITTSEKVENGYRMRVYYRFSEDQLNCSDSLRAFFFNDAQIETKITRVQISALKSRDTLIYLE